ncbi:MAG: serine hydrolase [Lachnospiraceae bacterium]|nr:serine hydrolase [Lachnospiraceae bacterium]
MENFTRQEFERCTPEEAGIRSEALLKLLDRLEYGGITEMHGLMIMRHGKVCLEGWWTPYAAGQPHMCASLTKTYMGTAIGMAIYEGLLTLDTHLTEIFPEFVPESPSEYFDELTIRHVLTMGSGMTQFPTMEGNWVQNFIATPLTNRPGTNFWYNSVGSTFLGKVIEKLTGKTVYEYLEEKLFPKIGINGRTVMHGIAPEGQDMWAWRTVSSTEDNLRLMKLYLDGGCVNGERLLPEEYVRLATSKQIENDNEPARERGEIDGCVGYGYQMWMCQPAHSYRADGAAGQYSIVLPDQDMIIAMNQNALGSNPYRVLQSLWDIVLPALSDEPIPADDAAKAAQEKLALRLKTLAIPGPEYRPYSPAKLAASGTYQVKSGTFDVYCLGMYAPEANPAKGFRIRFDDMEGELVWECTDNTCCRVEFALDGTRRYNRFRSPWQFATKCYANGVWESDAVFRLEELWPENNSRKTTWFTFTDGACTVSQVKGGLPGQPVETLTTLAVRL